MCELFDKNCRLVQCFLCQKYGHTKHTCKETVKCGHCAGDHNSYDCLTKLQKDTRKCACCAGGHAAWDKDCRKRKKQVQEVRRQLGGRATRYSQRTTQREPVRTIHQHRSIMKPPPSPSAHHQHVNDKHRKLRCNARGLCEPSTQASSASTHAHSRDEENTLRSTQKFGEG